jgi:hypothetical protein
MNQELKDFCLFFVQSGGMEGGALSPGPGNGFTNKVIHRVRGYLAYPAERRGFPPFRAS